MRFRAGWYSPNGAVGRSFGFFQARPGTGWAWILGQVVILLVDGGLAHLCTDQGPKTVHLCPSLPGCARSEGPLILRRQLSPPTRLGRSSA